MKFYTRMTQEVTVITKNATPYDVGWKTEVSPTDW